MITSTIQVDLRGDNETSDRAAMRIAYRAPHGCRLMVLVGDRQYVGPDLVSHLVKFVPTNVVDFVGTPEAVAAFTNAVLEAA